MTANKRSTYLLSLVALGFTLMMIIYSGEAFTSAVQGLKVWWEIVFPALLPFLVGSYVLMALGVVHFMGVLLEPFMRPVFDVPGTGSFVMAMGFASGYPVASVLTSELRRSELCSKTEGERLVSFATTADPLFMSGAVAVGMFASPNAVRIILAAQYLSAVAVGLIMRFYGPRQRRLNEGLRGRSTRNIVGRALQELCEARERDGRPLGKLLGDAIDHALKTLLAIGGFIILFSVLIRMLDIAGVGGIISSFFRIALLSFGFTGELSQAVLNGLLEVTLGTRFAATAAGPLYDRLIVANAIIAWGGLSVHAQIASIICGTGMSMKPFVLARLLHALLAGLICAFLLWAETLLGNIPVSLFAPSAHPGYLMTVTGPGCWMRSLAHSAGLFGLTSAGLFGLSLVVGFFGAGAYVSRFHHRRTGRL